MGNQDMDPMIMDGKHNRASHVSGSVMLWGIISIAVAIISVAVNDSSMVRGAGFFAKTFGVILGSVLGLIGALIGDALRKFAMPTRYFTNGGFFSLIFLRLFWMAGPQVIGLMVGVVLGCSLVLG